jgi:hypothetical protein
MSLFNQKNYCAILGLVALAVLIGLSLFFYRERIYFSDPAFQLFLLINDGGIEVMTNRWPSNIFRFLPYIGLKMGLPLATLTKLFSVSFPLYHFLGFAVCLWVFKDRVMAMLILFILLVATSETFYWCSSDLLQGMVTFMMGISAYRNTSNSFFKYGLSGFLLLAAVFFHPLCLFPFFFIVIYDYLEKDDWKVSFDLLFLPLVFGVGWIVRNQFFSTWYDTAKSAEFWGNYNGLDIWQLPVHKVFMMELPIIYNLLILLFIANVFIYIKKRNWLRPMFIIASILVYTLVIHIGNPTGIQSFYREASYISLAVFVSYPFLKHVFKHEHVGLKYRIVIPLLFMISFFRIYASSTDYTNRITYLQQKMEEGTCEKTVFTPSKRVDLKMEWAIPFETCLLSSETGDSKTLFNTDKPRDFLKQERRDAFLGPFKVLYTTEFNENYFDFGQSHYCPMNKNR